MVEITSVLINVGVGAFTGAAVAFTGYLSNMEVQKFELGKAMPTFIIGLVAGAISGFLSADPKSAVILALSGDVLRKSVKNYGQAKLVQAGLEKK